MNEAAMEYLESQHSSPLGENSKPDHHRVLIVDDEAAIRFAYFKLFQAELFSFDVCESIENAKAFLKKHDYFAVISDVRFEGSDNRDGLYFVSDVRDVQPEADVILVTGYGSDELEKSARQVGVSHYYEKPIKPSLILTLLRELHLVADEREINESAN
jgi:DNA-binding NtrC family response regulator